MKLAFVFICFLLSHIMLGQVTFIINELPVNHDYKKDIFISGDFENWSGGKDQFKLVQNNNVYSITLPEQSKTINFKFTLGSWEFVECQFDGNPIENRLYSYNKVNDTVNVKITNWSSNSQKTTPSTAAKNVHIFVEQFKMPQLNRERRISIYLPPDYESSNKKYPVLYMQDGQNVFDVSTSYSGEWEVDETLNKLSKSIGLNLIVVAVDHGNDKRISEYSPWQNSEYVQVEAEGDAYLDFIVLTLKPQIDLKYRTKTNAKNTGIMGSSMGGLISHYAVLKYPNIFGKIGVFSPSFWFSNESFIYSANHSNLKNVKIYFLAGDSESDTMVSDINKMIDVMKSNGFPEKNIFEKIVPYGTHSESLWKAEFESAILWLFSNN